MRRYIRQLGSETLVYGTAAVLARFALFFLVPIYTRVFTPGEYGVIASATAFLTVWQILIVAGLDAATTRWYYEKEDPEYRKQVIATWFWFQLLLGLAVSVVLVVVAPRISERLFAYNDRGIVYALASLLLFSTFSKVCLNTLRVQLRPWTTTVYTLAQTLGSTVAIIVFTVVLKEGITGVFVAQAIAAVAMAIATIALVGSFLNPKHISYPLLRDMLRFGLPVLPAGLFTWVLSYSDRFILARYADMSAVGIYSIAQVVTAPLGLIIAAFQMAYGPFSMTVMGKPESKSIYSRVLTVYALVGSAAVVGVTLFAGTALAWFTAPGYYGAESAVPYLAFSVLFSGAYYIAVTGLTIAKRPAGIAIGVGLGAACNFISNVLLVPRYGQNGAAIALVVGNAVSTAYIFVKAQKAYAIPYKFGEAFGLLGGALALIVAVRTFVPPSGWIGTCVRAVLCCGFVAVGFTAIWFRTLWTHPSACISTRADLE